MPVPISNFAKSSQDSSALLLEFLNANRSDSYNVNELLEMMKSAGKTITISEVEELLNVLEYGEKIESQTITNKVWFAKRNAQRRS